MVYKISAILFRLQATPTVVWKKATGKNWIKLSHIQLMSNELINFNTNRTFFFPFQLLLPIAVNEQEANPVIMKKWENDHIRNYFQMDRYCCSMWKKIGKVSICAKHTMVLARVLERWFNWKLIVRKLISESLFCPFDARYCFSFDFVASPYFSAPSRMVTVKKGDTANLQCEVNGDKPISVVWLRAGKHELNPSTNYR